MKSFIKCASSLLILCIASSSAQYENCEINNELDKQCGAYTYSVVKPFFRYVQQITDDIDKSELKDKEIKEQKEKLLQLDINAVTNRELRSQVADLRQNNNYLQRTIDGLTLISKCETCENRFNALGKALAECNNELSRRKIDLKACQSNISEKEILIDLLAPNSCVRFGQAAGIHRIEVPGINSLLSFDALCDSKAAGPGWMVIQRRFDGKENFYRDWASYRDGFGLLDGDFFLGLEKIYRLTSSQQFELYMYMEGFDGSIKYARYDHFAISGEDDGYALTSLGAFSGNVPIDELRYHEHQKFSTFDRENDIWPKGNCAVDYRAGWWYKACAKCHFTGRILDRSVRNGTSAYWHDFMALRRVQMLIRPKDK
ncbi:microfibril-associated glycoprotein 4-like [Drosophila albomicans]|uniref:Microfibril-associated glycoprotein 4-like n=1 Tax=Drosophila albomicans TaxID=7291 RepID=A0A6P8WWY9_DROAB|nr:microfibril-associated glycoprotein 4-like [Drosophila albomicans]